MAADARGSAAASPDSPVLTGWAEFDAAAHVLTDPLIARRTSAFVAYDPPRIDFDELLQASESWSPGERLLVLAALDLGDGRAHELEEQYGLRQLINTLTTEHVQRVLEGALLLVRELDLVERPRG